MSRAKGRSSPALPVVGSPVHLGIFAAEIRETIRYVLRAEAKSRVRLGVSFVDAKTIRGVNRRFLGHDRETDVIAFPYDGGTHPEWLDGEVIVSLPYAIREAKERRIPVHEELFRYIVHGILHVLGYEDEAPVLKRKMWDRQERYVEEIMRRRNRGPRPFHR